jgi:endoribonuclease Nob1
MADTTLVLDASGIIRSTLDYSGGGYLIPESVYQEIRSQTAKTAVEEAVRRGDIRVVQTDERRLAQVKKAAEVTGDISSLSGPDMDVLAVALAHNAAINSDDYAIHNTAAKLGLKVVGTSQEGIRKNIRWIWSCTGCGKSMGGAGICQICGHRAGRKPGQI